MKISELRAILSTYDDEQLVLVEGQVHDFVEPLVYVTEVRPERGEGFPRPIAKPSCAAVIVGSSGMLITMPF